MIRTLSEVSEQSLASLSFASRPYASDATEESQIPTRTLTDEERKLFDDLDEKFEEEGDEKLEEKAAKGKSSKKKEPADPLADEPADDSSGDGELSMEDF